MKNVAFLAVILGIIGNAANAESAVNTAPVITLAMNSTAAVERWVEPAERINADALASKIELNIAETMEKVFNALDKQLEEKLAKEIEYAMH